MQQLDSTNETLKSAPQKVKAEELMNPVRILDSTLELIRLNQQTEEDALHIIIVSIQQIQSYVQLYPGQITQQDYTNMVRAMIKRLETDDKIRPVSSKGLNGITHRMEEYTLDLKKQLLPRLRELLG